MDTIKEAMSKPMDVFAKTIAPYYTDLTIQLKQKEKNSPEWVQEKIKNGVEWAKSGRLDRAYEIWRNAYEKFPNSLALTYNLGVCEEAKGNLEKALEFYKKADRMLAKPDKDISNALKRIKKRIKQQGKIKKQIKTLP